MSSFHFQSFWPWAPCRYQSQKYEGLLLGLFCEGTCEERCSTKVAQDQKGSGKMCETSDSRAIVSSVLDSSWLRRRLCVHEVASLCLDVKHSFLCRRLF